MSAGAPDEIDRAAIADNAQRIVERSARPSREESGL